MTEQKKQEIAGLVVARLDGMADDSSLIRLRELLLNDPDAQAWYVEYCQLHSMLAWEHGGLPPVSFENIESTIPRSEVAVLSTRSTRRWQSLAMATSLMFFVSAGLLVYDFVVEAERPVAKPPLTAGLSSVREKTQAGILLMMDNPVWKGSDAPAALGEPFFNSRFVLKSGSVQIALFGGATIELKGPCEFDLESDKRVYLRQGDILVSIHNGDTKLVVDTPVGELLHLGTEFGVSVAKNGETEMYVFDGSVEVKQGMKGSPEGSARIFRVGAATRLAPSGRAEDLGREQYETFRLSHPSLASGTGFKPRPLSIDKAGYRVRYMKVGNSSLNSLSTADSVLSGRVAAVDDRIVERVPFIDFQDHPAADGKEYLNVFSLEEPFPGDNNGRLVNDDHFLIHATAKLVVRDAWRYTFLINVDDGARLRIDGKDVIVDDGIHPPQVSLGTVLLTPGEHTIELLAYDDSGFARVELGYAIGETNKLEQFVPLGVGE